MYKVFPNRNHPSTNALNFHWLLPPCPAQMIVMDEQGKRGCGQQVRPILLPWRIGWVGDQGILKDKSTWKAAETSQLWLKFPYCQKDSCVLLHAHGVGHGVALFSPGWSYICWCQRTKQAHSSSLTTSVLVFTWLTLLQLCCFLTTASLHWASPIACKGTLQPAAAPVLMEDTMHSSEEKSGKPHVLPSVWELSQLSPVCHPAVYMLSPCSCGSRRSSSLPLSFTRSDIQLHNGNWCCWNLLSYWGYWCLCWRWTWPPTGAMWQTFPNNAPRIPNLHLAVPTRTLSLSRAEIYRYNNPGLKLYSRKSPVPILAKPFSPLEKQIICTWTTHHEFGANRSPGLLTRKDPR